MALYNLSGIENATTISELVIQANRITEGTTQLTSGGILVSGFLVGIFVIMLMGLKRFGVQGIATSSFVCFIFSIFLRTTGLINFMFVIAFGAVTAFSVMYMVLNKSRS
jgi:hypothetical protein